MEEDDTERSGEHDEKTQESGGKGEKKLKKRQKKILADLRQQVFK